MQHSPRVYFITGVCGVGKSSTLKHLQKILPAESFDVRDFDERGVPDGGGTVWHNAETFFWLETAVANATQGKSTVVCGFAEPERFWALHNQSVHPPAQLLLLNASGETIRTRLLGRHATPETIAEITRAAGICDIDPTACPKQAKSMSASLVARASPAWLSYMAFF